MLRYGCDVMHGHTWLLPSNSLQFIFGYDSRVCCRHLSPPAPCQMVKAASITDQACVSKGKT